MKRSLLLRLTAAAAALPLASGQDESTATEDARLWEELSEVLDEHNAMMEGIADSGGSEEQWAELAAIMAEHNAMLGITPPPTPPPVAPSAPRTGGDPCSGDPCPFDSWCRSQYGSCGAGFMFCNDASTWKSDCKLSPVVPVADVPETEPTPPPAEPAAAPETSEPSPTEPAADAPPEISGVPRDDASGDSPAAPEIAVVDLKEGGREEVESAAPDSAAGEEVSTASAGESDQGSAVGWLVALLSIFSILGVGVALRRAKNSDDLERAQFSEGFRNRNLEVV